MKTIKVPHGKAFRTSLRNLDACPPAIEWVGKKSLKCAWRKCDRPDWMLWLALHVRVDKNRIAIATVRCANITFTLLPIRLQLALGQVIQVDNDDPFGKVNRKELILATERVTYSPVVQELDTQQYLMMRSIVRAYNMLAFDIPAYGVTSLECAMDTNSETRKRFSRIVRQEIPYKTVQQALEEWLCNTERNS